MNRFMAKANAEHLPGTDPRQWEGRQLALTKSRPRHVTSTDRRGVPQLSVGDEIWICTDKTGLGIAARARVASVEAEQNQVLVGLAGVEPVPRPVTLNDFGRLESGSRLISQLQRNRHPDIYFVDDEIFAEFEEAVRQRLGPDRVLPKIDWHEIASRNHAGARRELEIYRNTPLELRPARPNQRQFRLDLMGLYRGCCVITGCGVDAAVEAAHIIPWTGDPDLDRPENGLLLRRDIHGLFDAGLLVIDPENDEIVLAPALLGTEYADLVDMTISHFAAREALAARNSLFAEAGIISPDTWKAP